MGRVPSRASALRRVEQAHLEAAALHLALRELLERERSDRALDRDVGRVLVVGGSGLRGSRGPLGRWCGRFRYDRADSLARIADEERARWRKGRATQAKSSCWCELPETTRGAGRAGAVGCARCARLLGTTMGSVSYAIRRRAPRASRPSTASFAAPTLRRCGNGTSPRLRALARRAPRGHAPTRRCSDRRARLSSSASTVLPSSFRFRRAVPPTSRRTAPRTARPASRSCHRSRGVVRARYEGGRHPRRSPKRPRETPASKPSRPRVLTLEAQRAGTNGAAESCR